MILDRGFACLSFACTRISEPQPRVGENIRRGTCSHRANRADVNAMGNGCSPWGQRVVVRGAATSAANAIELMILLTPILHTLMDVSTKYSLLMLETAAESSRNHGTIFHRDWAARASSGVFLNINKILEGITIKQDRVWLNTKINRVAGIIIRAVATTTIITMMMTAATIPPAELRQRNFKMKKRKYE